MASVHSSLEKHLAAQLLYGGFCSPFSMFQLELQLAETKEETGRVLKKLIEENLSDDKKSVVVSLQDEKIQDLFDQAMRNLAQHTIERTLKVSETMESAAQTLAMLTHTLDRFKSKTWSEKTVDVVYRGLTKVGIMSAKPAKESDEVDVVLIEDCEEDEKSASEESDSWYEIERTKTYNQRVFDILRKWKGDPSLLLEIEPTKELMTSLRGSLSLFSVQKTPK